MENIVEFTETYSKIEQKQIFALEYICFMFTYIFDFFQNQSVKFVILMTSSSCVLWISIYWHASFL